MNSAYDALAGMRNGGVRGSNITNPGGTGVTPSSPRGLPSPYSTPFQQNPFLAQQVGNFGGVPQWMMQAYAQKIGQMGGNANNPPFPVTPGGFTGGQQGQSALPSFGGKVGLPSSITNPGQQS